MLIKNWKTKETIYESDHETLAETVISALEAGVDLRGADLRETDLSEIDLSGVDLRETDLSGANLCGTNLKGASLCDAKFERTLIRFRGKIVAVNFTEIS